jgi:hypothetical protein
VGERVAGAGLGALLLLVGILVVLYRSIAIGAVVAALGLAAFVGFASGRWR